MSFSLFLFDKECLRLGFRVSNYQCCSAYNAFATPISFKSVMRAQQEHYIDTFEIHYFRFKAYE
jgi:hypothetical protein